MMVNVPVCERCWFDRAEFGAVDEGRARVPTRLRDGFDPPRACAVCEGLTVAGILASVDRKRLDEFRRERDRAA